MDEGSYAGTTIVEPWRWYTVDLRVDATASPARIDWMLDGRAQVASLDVLEDPVDMGVSEFGLMWNDLATTTTVRFDDYAVSSTLADYPLGAGRAVPLLPSSNGVNTTPANFGRSTDHGLGFTPFVAGDDNADPGVSGHLDDWPIDQSGTADLVRQTGTAGQLQVQVQDTAETAPPNAVRITGAFEEPNWWSTQLVEVRARNGTGGATIGAIASFNPESAGEQHYGAGTLVSRPAGGAWTVADLNNLVLEVDSTNVGTAANERPWTNALLVEADTPTQAAPISISPPEVAVPFSTVKVGDVLTAEAGTWNDGGLGVSTFTWLRCTAAGEGCVPIADATSSTYTTVVGDVGSTIRTLERREGSARANQTARSSATSEVANAVPSPLRLTGFEGGTLASTLHEMTSGTAPTVVAGSARSGSQGLRTNAVGTQSLVWYDTSSPRVAIRTWVRFDALPSGFTGFLGAEVNSPGNYAMLDIDATGQLSAHWETPGWTGVVAGDTVVAGRWYLVDLSIEGGGSNPTLRWKIDGKPQPQSTCGCAGGATLNRASLGNTFTVNSTMSFDDVLISTTANDWPLGGGHIEPLRATSMGTSAPSASFRNDDGTVIDSTTPGRVDDSPFGSITDFIRQTAVASASTDYAELQVEDPSSTAAAQLVGATVGYHTVGGAAGTGATKVLRGADGEGAAITVHSGSMTSGSLVYAQSAITRPAPGWTFAQLAGLRFHVGYSAGATTSAWDAALLEADYRE
jgi:hypothetical protein